MRAVALTMSLALTAGACFPNNAKHRTIAKVVEGGVTVGGIVLLYFSNTGADCMTDIPGMPDTDCENKASLIGTVGLGLVLAGLIGFIVTVSTSPDDNTTTAGTPAAAPVAPIPEPPPTGEQVEPATPPPADPVPPTDPIPPTEPVPPTEPTTPTTP